MNTPALVPAIPNDRDLEARFPIGIDLAGIENELKDLDGRTLANQGPCGGSRMQELVEYQTEIKKWRKQWEHDYWESDAGAYERLGDAWKKYRCEVLNRAEAIYRVIGIKNGDYEDEAKRLAKIVQLEEEAKQRRLAEEDRIRELAMLESLKSLNAPPETVAEVQAQINHVQATPVTPAAVPLSQARTSGGIAPRAAGTSTTPVCWRKVKAGGLQQLFAYLGSEQGKGLIGALCVVKSEDRKSDVITISFADWNKDTTSEYPGLVNVPGRISSNRGK